MRRRLAVKACCVALIASACDLAPDFSDAERELLRSLRYDPSPPPADVSNEFSDSPQARLFGRRLFFDPSLSGPLIDGDHDGTPGTLGRRGEPGKVSCASCHVPETSFVDTRSRNRQISLGAQWTMRRAPTLLESASITLFNWDGRRDSMWRQAMGVMESEREYNSGRLFVAQQIFRQYRADYEAIFGAMPPLDDPRFTQLAPNEVGCTATETRDGVIYDCRGRPDDGADYDALGAEDQDTVTRVTVNVSKAMAAYVQELRCGESAFDAWLDGDENALSTAEQRGAALFIGRAGCISCHSGPNFTDGEFHNVGLRPAPVAVAFIDANDHGAYEGIAAAIADPLNTRGPYSDGDRGVLPDGVGPELEGAFRTPTLRCAADYPSYMHTGQLRSLTEVVRFFVRGGDPDGYPGTNELTPLDLTEEEIADLVAFLGALTGPGPEATLLGP